MKNDLLPVRTGAEIFLEKHLDLVQGKKVGLVTNPTGVDGELNSLVKIMYNHPDIQLVALYSPEHGVRGNAQAGEYVPFYIDEKFKLPVFSLYGQSKKPDPDMLSRIDEFMRSFDINESGKIPEQGMVHGVDLMIFDIQDVGTRIYTYVATMAYCMQVCAEMNIPFLVFDRPNPITGDIMEGPILEFPTYSSFVGLYPIPVRHGMTVGELAYFFNNNYLEKKADLVVIPMENWKRTMWFDETGLPWIIPSPNMPTPDTATVYPGMVFLEGTNISEGRGTTRPFEIFGAPWIDGHELCLRLNRLMLPGVRFREAWFTPVFSKYAGEVCGGGQIHITDRNRFRSWRTGMSVIRILHDMYPDRFQFHSEYFDKIMGTAFVRKALESGLRVEELLSKVEEDLVRFQEKRQDCLLYD